jgi:hypothetical protein
MLTIAKAKGTLQMWESPQREKEPGERKGGRSIVSLFALIKELQCLVI